MSKKEKNWRRFYLGMMIFVYAIFVPISILEWIGGGGFPFAAVAIGIGAPFMRKNHLNTIRKEESSSL